MRLWAAVENTAYMFVVMQKKNNEEKVLKPIRAGGSLLGRKTINGVASHAGFQFEILASEWLENTITILQWRDVCFH